MKEMSAMLIEGTLNAVIYWIAPRCSHYKHTPGVIDSSLKNRGSRPFTNQSSPSPRSSHRPVSKVTLSCGGGFFESSFQDASTSLPFKFFWMQHSTLWLILISLRDHVEARTWWRNVFRYLFINILACSFLLSCIRTTHTRWPIAIRPIHAHLHNLEWRCP